MSRSGIYASVDQVESFTSDVRDAHSSMQSKYDQTISHANATLERANRALNKAGQALNEMIGDYNKAEKTLAHNRALLEMLRQKLDIILKAKAAAQELIYATEAAFKAAKEEQTAAKNSSASTPEEEKARSARIKAANKAVAETKSAYLNAKEEYNRLCREERETRYKISETASAISTLENMIYHLKGQINEAEAFISDVKAKADRLHSAGQSFSNSAGKTLDKLARCHNSAEGAKESLTYAVHALSRAGGGTGAGSYGLVVSMSDPSCISPMTKQISDTHSEVERNYSSHKHDARSYGEAMQDDISEAAVYVSLEICECIREASELLDEVRKDLRDAQSQLNNYISYASFHI